MRVNRKRPEGSRPERGEKSLYFVETDKDIPKISNRQRNVLNLLRQGRYSATDITIALGFCDPRSYIKALRDKGFNIMDEWIENEDTRYKKYWL